MQRGISGKTRRGAPPLPRQKRALRVVQVTLLALAVFLAFQTIGALSSYRIRPSDEARRLKGARSTSITQVLVLAGGTVAALAGAAAMGFRVVRGPEPPRLQ